MKFANWWNRRVASIGFLAVVCAVAVITAQPAPNMAADEPATLQTFMRKKLDASSMVLEGLAVDDHELIKKGALALQEMSKSEKWNVLTDEDYRNFNREFRSSIRKLEKAADEKDTDNALLQWMAATKSCVECHKYVRQQRGVLKK